MTNCYESGFRSDSETIYVEVEAGEFVTNQYEGIRDIHLAIQLAKFLGIDVEAATAFAPTPESEVRALQEAADE